jgi:NAD(P)-dependent dehydrogenase (short-subunit alcohol dehydrogenase family)
VADTPAVRVFEDHKAHLAEALERNPTGRLTTPEEVAKVLVALAAPEITRISGAVIPVDGGESIVG